MYPIQRLNIRITSILEDIKSADILGNVNRGLQNQIEFIDEDSHITDVCTIVKSPLDGLCRVKLSVAFCQFFWLICDYCLKEIDFSIIKEECTKYSISLQDYKQYVENILQNPMQSTPNLMQVFPNISVKHYTDYLHRTIQLLDQSNFELSQSKDLEMAASLLIAEKTIDANAINKLNIDGPYEQKVNAVYCFGIAFVLLHELSHYDLGHMETTTLERVQEEDADLAAFWGIYNDIDDNRHFTANIGILCMIFSLLMLNSKMEEDGIHPREDQRIFMIYDNIKDEDPKYTVLMIRIFKIWSAFTNRQDFPIVNDDSEKSLQQIREYFNHI